MKLSEKGKRWLRRLDLAVMVWWTAYMTARLFFPKYYPQTDISDTITMLGGFLMTFMAPWLKIYEVRDVPKEDLIWMKRIRYGLFMWPLLFDMAYQCYLLFLK